MNIALALVKFFFVLLSICFYFLLSLPFFPFLRSKSYIAIKGINLLVSKLSSVILFILNIKVKGSKNLRNIEGKFIVSNHLSYLDILVISKFVPTSFVTSVEMKETPFLGQITQLAGCVFVERRNKNRIREEIKELEVALSNNINITVFPEATSTNGEKVHPFKRPLFNAAIGQEKNIVNLVINYKSINKEMINLNNRDFVFWYGDMGFVDHLFKLCLQEEVFVDLDYLGETEVTKEANLEEIKDKSYLIIHENFNCIT